MAALMAEAEGGMDVLVTRRRQPVTSVIGISSMGEVDQATADLDDLALVLARAATDTGQRTSLDNVLAAFGHTHESLSALQDDD